MREKIYGLSDAASHERASDRSGGRHSPRDRARAGKARREMTSATVSMCSTSAAAPRVAADSRRRATAGASRRRHRVASPETGSARAAGTGWTGRETRAIERRPSPARSGDRGVVSRALLGDQEVRPNPTRPTARRVRIPEKSAIVSPRFSLEIPACAPRAADGRGAPTVLARVPQRARSRADRRSREPSRSANSRGEDPRVCSAERGRTAPPAPIVASLALENPVHDSSFSTRCAPNTAFFARRNARKKPNNQSIKRR